MPVYATTAQNWKGGQVVNTSTYAYTTSSKRLVSGRPAVVGSLDEFSEQYDELLAEAIEQTLQSLRSFIRTEALRDAAWSEFVDIIDVEFDGLHFNYVLTGDDQERIQAALDLEYGSEFQRPSPLFRKFALDSVPMINERLTVEMLNGS